MATQVDTAQREIVLVEDAHIRPMMGNQVLESLPSRRDSDLQRTVRRLTN
jgi:hypothetical protein